MAVYLMSQYYIKDIVTLYHAFYVCNLVRKNEQLAPPLCDSLDKNHSKSMSYARENRERRFFECFFPFLEKKTLEKTG